MAEFIEGLGQIIHFFVIITPFSGLLYLVSTGLARRFINLPKPLRLKYLLAEKKFDHKSAMTSINIPLLCEYNIHGTIPSNDIKRLARPFANQSKPLHLKPLLVGKKLDPELATKSNNIPLLFEYNINGITSTHNIIHALEIMRERLTNIIENINMASSKSKMSFDYQDRQDETNEYE